VSAGALPVNRALFWRSFLRICGRTTTENFECNGEFVQWYVHRELTSYFIRTRRWWRLKGGIFERNRGFTCNSTIWFQQTCVRNSTDKRRTLRQKRFTNWFKKLLRFLRQKLHQKYRFVTLFKLPLCRKQDCCWGQSLVSTEIWRILLILPCLLRKHVTRVNIRSTNKLWLTHHAAKDIIQCARKTVFFWREIDRHWRV